MIPPVIVGALVFAAANGKGRTPQAKLWKFFEPYRCHSGSDGDCFWSKCPQKRVYKTICPLYVEQEEW